MFKKSRTCLVKAVEIKTLHIIYVLLSFFLLFLFFISHVFFLLTRVGLCFFILYFLLLSYLFRHLFYLCLFVSCCLFVCHVCYLFTNTYCMLMYNKSYQMIDAVFVSSRFIFRFSFCLSGTCVTVALS